MFGVAPGLVCAVCCEGCPPLPALPPPPTAGMCPQVPHTSVQVRGAPGTTGSTCFHHRGPGTWNLGHSRASPSRGRLRGPPPPLGPAWAQVCRPGQLRAPGAGHSPHLLSQEALPCQLALPHLCRQEPRFAGRGRRPGVGGGGRVCFKIKAASDLLWGCFPCMVASLFPAVPLCTSPWGGGKPPAPTLAQEERRYTVFLSWLLPMATTPGLSSLGRVCTNKDPFLSNGNSCTGPCYGTKLEWC